MANGHKAWTHLFIPDDEVKANRTLDDYVKAFAVTGAGLAREEKEKKRVSNCWWSRRGGVPSQLGKGEAATAKPTHCRIMGWRNFLLPPISSILSLADVRRVSGQRRRTGNAKLPNAKLCYNTRHETDRHDLSFDSKTRQFVEGKVEKMQ